MPFTANGAARVGLGFGKYADDAFGLLRFELDVAWNFEPFKHVVDRVYIEHVPERSVVSAQIAGPVRAIRHHHYLRARQSGLGRTRSDAGILRPITTNHLIVEVRKLDFAQRERGAERGRASRIDHI